MADYRGAEELYHYLPFSFSFSIILYRYMVGWVVSEGFIMKLLGPVTATRGFLWVGLVSYTTSTYALGAQIAGLKLLPFCW